MLKRTQRSQRFLLIDLEGALLLLELKWMMHRCCLVHLQAAAWGFSWTFFSSTISLISSLAAEAAAIALWGTLGLGDVWVFLLMKLVLLSSTWWAETNSLAKAEVQASIEKLYWSVVSRRFHRWLLRLSNVYLCVRFSNVPLILCKIRVRIITVVPVLPHPPLQWTRALGALDWLEL